MKRVDALEDQDQDRGSRALVAAPTLDVQAQRNRPHPDASHDQERLQPPSVLAHAVETFADGA